MAKAAPPTTPVDTDRMPPGVPYIIGNEAAERFSFYGMRTILVVFMTQYLMNRAGVRDVMNPEQAKVWFHLFVFAVYFLPFFGAILSDVFWGKYRTILVLSIVYCFGHLALALDDTRIGLYIGLVLIAIGAGGIKPCVSANVGDQFGPRNRNLLPTVFGWFYFSINFGSCFSTILTPWLLDVVGPKVAFGVPGIFMLLATIVFWMGRNTYTRVPPAGMSFWKETFGHDGRQTMFRLIPLYIAVAVFWSLWDQTGSAWVLQLEKMDRVLFGRTILPAQVQAVNPVFILLLIPACSYIIYPAINRFWPLTPLRKIGMGLFLTVPSFLISAWIEREITAGHTPSMLWQVGAFVIISLAEIMVSVTCLEFSYTQSPARMKSFIMSFYLLSIAGGNLFTSIINAIIQNADGTSKLPGASYYLFFSCTMFVTAVCFIFLAVFYREPDHVKAGNKAA